MSLGSNSLGSVALGAKKAATTPPSTFQTAWVTVNYLIGNDMYKKNTAVIGFTVGLVSATDGSDITTGTPVGFYKLDSGTQTAIADVTPVHDGNGQWSFDLTAAEMNGDTVGLTFTHASAITQHFNLKTDTKITSDLNDLGGVAQSADNDTKLSTIVSTTSTIVADTNELQTNQGNWLTATGFNTTTPLTAAGVRSAVGLATANMDTQFTASATATGFNTTVPDNSSIAAILTNTGTTIPAQISGLNNLSFSDIWTGNLTESYAADNSVFTPAQGLHMIWADLRSPQQVGTVWTDFKLNGTTAAMTFSLDDATTPTKKNRVT